MLKIAKKAEETIQSFLEWEAAGGICLVIAGAIAVFLSNGPLYHAYESFLHAEWPGGVSVGGHGFSLLLFINDALMAIFFFLVGLEIKQEVMQGELSTRERALLPALAAVGGMVVPALMYLAVNAAFPENHPGWAIPSATDIAFSLGVLSLLGSRVPLSLKILLTAIAVIDDLGAIAIIAVFYTDQIEFFALAAAAAIITVLYLLSRREEAFIPLYLILGVALWFAVLQSGIHATLAGVATAMFIPVQGRDGGESPSKAIERRLHPWVAFGILPLFALANAGVPLTGMGWGSLGEPVTLGIVFGLFVGKQIGIFGSIWLAVKSRVSPMPEDVSWGQIYGMAVLCGIGFTMSLFIGGLAFDDLYHQAEIRLGVLAGSLLSALVGYVVLRKCSGKSS